MAAPSFGRACGGSGGAPRPRPPAPALRILFDLFGETRNVAGGEHVARGRARAGPAGSGGIWGDLTGSGIKNIQKLFVL